MLGFLTNTVIVTGHYGSGKTNLAVNLALDLHESGRDVALVDLDIVNPYFRSADFAALAESKGVPLYTPEFANTNVDLPTLAPQLMALIGSGTTVVVDVGGDDTGAVALGSYSARIKETPYTMLYVVNAYRYMTREPQEAVKLLGEIEQASRLTATHLVNNSHLSYLTTARDVEKSMPYAQRATALAGRPLAMTSVRRDLAPQLKLPGVYPVEIYVKTPWQ